MPLEQFVEHDVALQRGGRLAECVTAYATLGRLNAARDNAVLVLHGYTTGPDMLSPDSTAAEGSWAGLVGPGLAVDTDRCFVLCPNLLGYSYGSTGPRSIDPATGRVYGPDFPALAVADSVDAQARLCSHLGIEKLHAAIGPSLGAMQAFSWGVRHPARVARVVAAVGSPYRPAGVVPADKLRPMFDARPYDAEALRPWLLQQRIQTLRAYGMAGTDGEVEARAALWAREFDAAALLVLAEAVSDFDVRAELHRMTAPLLFVLSRSDTLFPPSLRHELAPLFNAALQSWRFVEIDSDQGHLASGADAALWAAELAAFIEMKEPAP